MDVNKNAFGRRPTAHFKIESETQFDYGMTLTLMSIYSPFYQSDLDHDPMTLILKKMSHHTKIEVSMSRHSKVIA